MAYNVGDYLLNEKKIASGPNTYAWLRYDQATRTGKNVYLKFYIKTNLQYDSSYRADACSVNLWISYSRLNDDGTTTWTDVSIFNGVHKPQKSGSTRSGTGWPKDRYVDITVPTAASDMLININIWDSTGAHDYDWYMGAQTINIPPGAPILANSGSPSVLCNKATWTVYDTLGFTCTEYKVFNGNTEIQHATNVDSSTFNVTITGLSPNIEYSGYKVQALANGVWSDKISLTTIKTTPLPECILSYNSSNGNIYLGWPNSWRSTANPRLSLVSGTIAIPNNNVNFSVDNNTQRDDYDVNYDYFLLHTLTTSDKDKIANANQSSNNGNISVTWMRTVDNGYYDQSASFSVDISSYKPIFYSNYITSVIDTLSYMSNNITNSNTVFIKGLNLPQVTFAKMAPNYSYPDYYNITNYGNLVVPSGTETATHTITMYTPLSNNSFDITAYNGRGSRKATKTIDMIEYSKPTINFFDAVRTNGVDTTADITISGTYTKWRSGLKVNNSFPTIQYSINGGTSWSSLALSPTYNNDGTWSASMRLPGEYSLDNSYPVKIRLLDQVGKVLSDNNSALFYGWTESNISTIPTGKVMLWKDLLRKWLGIGKKPTCSLDVVGDIKNDGTINGHYFGRVLGAGTDLNYVEQNGWFGLGGSPVNGPTTDWGTLIVQTSPMNGTPFQIYIDDAQNKVWKRSKQNGSWNPWILITKTVDDMYPIGSVYMTRLRPDDFNPNYVFGGSWRIIGSVDSSSGYGYDERFLYVMNRDHQSWEAGSGNYGTSTDGHAITENEMPSHTHTQASCTNPGNHSHGYGYGSPKRAGDGSKWNTCADGGNAAQTQPAGGHTHTITLNNTGGGAAHSHTVHYIGVFVWERYN